MRPVPAEERERASAEVLVAPGSWMDGERPPNVRLGPGTLITGRHAFRRFHSRRDPALEIGAHGTFEDVHFAIGPDARVCIGDYCYFTSVILLCELELRIGNYVMIGFNTTIADSDFHPIAPAERIADAIACSPLREGHTRPPFIRRAVVIEDDVWIGPSATILKGVRIGAGAFVEAGSLVAHDVSARARVAGNPARVIGEVGP
jgi:acetyltransferase-like isoleucine patch superfamily enzyme